jgi:multiple sugar transport system substrate-binding protein
MAAVELEGLAWRHRRATGPLAPLSAAFAAIRPDVAIRWTDRSLAGFEHQPIAELAKAFDLLIFDHPFAGDVAEAGAFLQLDREMPELLGPDADRLYVGPTLASYRYEGAVWGAPIDAATEHALLRPDLIAQAGEIIGESWADAMALGARLRRKGLFLGAAVATPHLGLVVAALMANACAAWPTDARSPFAVDIDALREALEAVLELVDYCPREALNWNSIDLHEAMVARDDVAYSPCAYGYATYGEAGGRARLGFADFPGRTPPFAAGSAIGGAALGVSAFTRHREAAIAFVRMALSADAQREIARHHGQPARVEAWADSAIDRRFNGYFSSVRKSMELAWVRPRMKAYIKFQHEFGLIVERMGRRELSVATAIDAVARIVGAVG